MSDISYKKFLGIDAGSLSIKIAFRENGEIKYYRKEHLGEPLTAFDSLIKENNLKFDLAGTIITGKYSDILSKNFNIPVISPIYCLVNTIDREKYADIKYFIDIGSSGLSIIEIQDGKFHRYDTNSLCAAGTGAFLDQQMERMKLTYEDVENIPIIENPPSIASRCAVFAKSDLIHRQQQGYSIEQLWNGLVKGLAESAYTTLFRGKIITDDVFLIGGLAKNKIFIHFFQKLLGDVKLRVADGPDYFLSGSLIKYLSNPVESGNLVSINNEAYKATYEKPLSFKENKVKNHINYLDVFNNEVDIWHLESGKKYNVFAGVDIGSTSTKMSVIDESGQIMLGLYTRTQGKPIEAFKNLLEGICIIQEEKNVSFNIKGLGTTGSGRKLVGKFAGADIIKNEITAHLKGAIKEFPDVKTIFEIGGQDSKYIFIEDGWMKDASMNYVCAAGTGSFLEEQAKNLNIKLDDIPALCKDAKPPISSDRCTVFMEQDSNQLLTNGYKRNQVMSSILYSVCKNYLHKVVQNKAIEEPILFLGATAKNSGLVEAFENVVNKKIHTSQYSHVMGSIGIAEMLRNTPPSETKFKGLDIRFKEIVLSEDNCTLCTNKCLITHMQIAGEDTKTSWGYMCGKEPDEKSVKNTECLDAFNFLKQTISKREVNKDVIMKAYFPKALQYFSFHPFWSKFFNALKIELIPTPTTNSEINSLAKSYALSDFCYPLKLALGHAMYCIKHDNYPVVIPFHIQDTKNPKALNSYFCPLSQAFPTILKSALGYNNINTDNILSPIIDFSKADDYNIKQLEKTIGKSFGINTKQIRLAFKQAKLKNAETKKELSEFGKNYINNKKTNKPRFVILGRSYNILDQSINLGLLSTIARYGYDVIPMDVLPINRESISEEFKDMYWAYGQKIVAAANYINKHDDLYPIYLSNFSCGPDSFLLGTFEEIMTEKPYLILELDEHGGDAGYMTRLEAYFDRVDHYYESKKKPVSAVKIEKRIKNSLANNKVYVPPMHPIGSRLVSAAIRAYGIDSVPLVKEDIETFTLGSAFVRGSECMPATSTIGAFLHKISKENDGCNENTALFMPCASGPCRFGLYARLHNKILRENNIEASIISPSFDDNYGDIKGGLRIHFLKAMIVSDILYKLACKLRPYEKTPGLIDEIIEEAIVNMEKVFENKNSISSALRKLNSKLKGIEFYNNKKPLVGVVGEIYVRNSQFSNSNLVKQIESNGGEAWVAPMMEWLHYSAELKTNKNILDFFSHFISTELTAIIENKYLRIFDYFLKVRKEPPIKEIIGIGKKFVPVEVEGEPVLTIGRAIGFINQGAKLIVNVSPFGCMPGQVCSSVFKDVSNKYNTPIVSVFYDGETNFTDLIGTYISNAK
ncbi:MAG: acyl-CoA dehydratase activase [Bacteroidales bacterium]